MPIIQIRIAGRADPAFSERVAGAAASLAAPDRSQAAPPQPNTITPRAFLPASRSAKACGASSMP